MVGGRPPPPLTLSLPPGPTAWKRDRDAPSDSVVLKRRSPRGRRFCGEPTPVRRFAASAPVKHSFSQNLKVHLFLPIEGGNCPMATHTRLGTRPLSAKGSRRAGPPAYCDPHRPQGVRFRGSSAAHSARSGARNDNRAQHNTARLSRAGAGRPAGAAYPAPPPSERGLPG